MEIKLLTSWSEKNNLPDFRRKQILKYYYSHPVKSWDDFSSLPKELRSELSKSIELNTSTLELFKETDDVIKFLFKMNDGGHKVESVIMKHEDGRRTLCLSCQAGCPMGCYFCATGTMGLKKNLSAGEIADMARSAEMFLRERGEGLSNVVYMGMGEPLANYAAVKESLNILHDFFGLGWRKISVSTCGVVPKIMEFAKDFPQVNLAISLHAALDEKRSKMMPINDRFGIKVLMKTCHEYAELTHRKVFFEYLVIDNFNDMPEDVTAIKKIFTHHLFHLNLIRFHETDAVKQSYGVAWKAPTRENLDRFMKELKTAKIPYTLRRSFGERIDAACGMLAVKNS